MAPDLQGIYPIKNKITPEILSQDGRRFILLEDGKLHENVSQAIEILAESGEIYQRNGTLVRPTTNVDANDQFSGCVVDPQASLIRALNYHELRVILTRLASFYRWSDRFHCFLLKNCPLDLARSVLSNGTWNDLAILDGITSSPILRHDGSLHIEPGYDQLSRQIYQPTLPIQLIPGIPTLDDAVRGIEALREPFARFDFVADEDFSVLLSFLLTIIARHLCPTVPMFLFTAPTPGSGKTLLVRCISKIAVGNEPTLHRYSRSEEERQKALTAASLRGLPLFHFDNVPNGEQIDSAALSGFITTSHISDRLLGTSQTVMARNTSVVAFTGNNVTVEEDLVRRTLLCRLDPRCEQPELRKYPFHPIEFIKRHRAQLVAAALTILSAYLRAGAPRQTSPLGSFEDWSNLVRGAAIWAGLPDPCLTQSYGMKRDIKSHRLLQLLTALNDTFSNRLFKVKEAIEHASQPASTLKAALSETFNGALPTSQQLGKYFETCQGRVIDGLRLEDAGLDSHDKVKLWGVVHV